MMTVLILLSILATVYLLLYWRWRYRAIYIVSEKLPGPLALPILGNALNFACSNEELMDKLADMIKKYGDTFRFWLGTDLNIVLSDPYDVKLVLSSAKMNTKGPQYRFMAEIIGKGILAGSGAIWRKHRKLALPNYGKRALKSYEDIFNNESDILLETLTAKSKLGMQFNIMPDIVRHTSLAVCQTLMALPREQALTIKNLNYVIENTHAMYERVFTRMTQWWCQPILLYKLLGYHKYQKEFMMKITQFSHSILGFRRESLIQMGYVKLEQLEADVDNNETNRVGVVDRFLLSNDLNEEELINGVFTIFTTSQEATAKITSFLLTMLAYHPECQEKLYSEIMNKIGNKTYITDVDLKLITYMEMILNEVLRLFPIACILQRSVTEDFQMSSTILPAGTSVVIPLYQMHRDPRYWERPNDFYPERFSPDYLKDHNMIAFIPFSLGPMDCLGRYFAKKLIKTICIKIVRDFKITSHETYKDFKLAAAVSMASVTGYNVILTSRY